MFLFKYKKREIIPSIIQDSTCDIYKITPTVIFPIIIVPTAVIRNAGPEHIQNNIICCACDIVISFLSYSIRTHFAPIGNPPIRLSIIVAEHTDGSPKRNLVTFENNFPTTSENLERIANEESTIKGNSDGIRSVTA